MSLGQNNVIAGTTFNLPPATTKLLLFLLWSLEVRDSKRTDCRRRDNAPEPRLPIQSGINSANNPANSNGGGNNHSRHALNKDECIDAMVLYSARLGLDLRLLENPIDPIRANTVQTLNAANRNDGRVGLCRLNGNLVAVAILCVCARMPVGHVSAPCACPNQLLRNPRAGARHPRQTLDDQRDIRAEAAKYPAQQQHHLTSFSDDRPWSHGSRLACPTHDSLFSS